MIVYQLVCCKGHEFDTWFRDGASYGLQVAARQVSCPHCGTTDVSKAIMAPNVITRSRTTPQDNAERDNEGHNHVGRKNENLEGLVKRGDSDELSESRALEVASKILEVVNSFYDKVKENCDDVGKDFPEEARRIHYGEAEERGIYGEASQEEAEDLKDEGIDLIHFSVDQLKRN